LLPRTFYSSDGFCVDVERKCRGDFSVHGEPPRETLSARLLNSSGKQEVCDTRVKGRQFYATLSTQEVTGAAREALTRSSNVQHNISGSHPALHGKSVVMTCRILQLNRPLSENGIVTCYAFAWKQGALLEYILGVSNVT
jgi:hypothetical protein